MSEAIIVDSRDQHDQLAGAIRGTPQISTWLAAHGLSVDVFLIVVDVARKRVVTQSYYRDPDGNMKVDPRTNDAQVCAPVAQPLKVPLPTIEECRDA